MKLTDSPAMPGRSLLALVCLGAAGAFAQAARIGDYPPFPLARVIVVDDELGPGVDFVDLQLAIDAARVGDVLLIRDGTYDTASTITIEKGVTLQADESATIDFVQDPKPTIEIRDIPKGQAVVLRGLRSTEDPVFTTRSLAARMVVSRAQGVVWIEDSDLSSDGAAAPALHAMEALAVVAIRCDFLSGPKPGFPYPSGRPVLLENSSLHLFSSRAKSFYCPWSGAKLDGSFLFATGSEISGGNDDCVVCPSSGNGGAPGVELSNRSQAVLRDTSVTGGGGSFWCPMTPTGPPFLEDGTSSHAFLPGDHLAYQATTPRREGEFVRQVFRGPPGHEVHLVSALSGSATFDGSLGGSVLVPSSLLFSGDFQGVIPPSGELVTITPVELLPRDAEGEVTFAQALFVDPATGQAEVGDGSVRTLLDGSIETALLDCDRNGNHDPIDVARFISIDCNRNGVPDSCDTAAGTSKDCNQNAVPDECEAARFVDAFDLEELGLQDLRISDLAASDDHVVVGATSYDDDAGAVLVFGYDDGGVLALEALLQPSEPLPFWFGRAVDVQGDTIAVTDAGDAYVFERDSLGQWFEQARIVGPPFVPGAVAFGSDIALDDRTLVVGDSRSSIGGGSFSGAAFVFCEVNGVWLYQATLDASDTSFTFGFPDVRVEIEDDTILVGVESHQLGEPGTVHIYLRQDSGTPSDPSDDSWIEAQELDDGDPAFEYLEFGRALGIGDDGSVLVGSEQYVINGINAGAVVVFDRHERGSPGDPLDDQWVQSQVLTPSDGEDADSFGAALSVAGSDLLIGTENINYANNLLEPGAYVFKKGSTGEWAEKAILFPLVRTGHDFGGLVALAAEHLFVAERFIFDGMEFLDGSVHTFARSDKDFDGIPDDCELILTHGPLIRGQRVVFEVFGDAAPGEWVTIVFSTTGAGFGPCILGTSLCLDVLDPLAVLGSVRVGSGGVAMLGSMVPAAAALVPVHTQAVLLRGPGGIQSIKSNVATRTIQPRIVASRRASETGLR